jgi:hypothetical protein
VVVVVEQAETLAAEGFVELDCVEVLKHDVENDRQAVLLGVRLDGFHEQARRASLDGTQDRRTSVPGSPVRQ